MKRVIVAVPHSHSWFWTQTCLSCLLRYPPAAPGCDVKIVAVDNSPWSPSFLGLERTRLGKGVHFVANTKPNKFHASALDLVVELDEGGHIFFDGGPPCDYLFTLETDVAVLRHGWLAWFVDHLERYDNWFAVGHWHHEAFINPSCTLYRGKVLRDMAAWCRSNTNPECRWGPNFEFAALIDPPDNQASIRGPFAEKRGWPEGTQLREPPSGQCKGAGWYEPGQALYAWARDKDDLGYFACPTFDRKRDPGWPIHTFYGRDMPEQREYELSELFDAGPYACHFWRGTGALNILKHPDVDWKEAEFRNYCLPREARFWLQAVDADVREQTLALIRKHGWHTENCFGGPATDRDREAVRVVEDAYAKGGVRI